MTTTTPTRVPWRAVLIFTLTACGLAALVCLPLWLGDGLAEPFAGAILPVMMFTPAAAVLVVMLTTGVPEKGVRARFLGMWPLRPAKRVVGLLVAAWLVPPVLVALGILLAAVLGWVRLDLTFSAFADQLAEALPAGAPVPPVGVVVFAQLAAIPVGALVNSVLAFG